MAGSLLGSVLRVRVLILMSVLMFGRLAFIAFATSKTACRTWRLPPSLWQTRKKGALVKRRVNLKKAAPGSDKFARANLLRGWVRGAKPLGRVPEPPGKGQESE